MCRDIFAGKTTGGIKLLSTCALVFLSVQPHTLCASVALRESCVFQSSPDTTAPARQVSPADSSNNSLSQHPADSLSLNRPRAVRVSVSPEGACNAAITIVRRDKIELSNFSMSTSEISPDTMGTWRAPLSLLLSHGDYDFIANNSGFKRAVESVTLADTSEHEISFDLLSFEYLRQKREQWGRYKWISAGVAAGAGLAARIFYKRIGSSQNAYNSAVALSAIQADKNTIKLNQTLYTISSAIAFTAIGNFIVSWIVQGLYHK